MYNILAVPGDGIGPEVLDATLRVLGWYSQNRNFAATIEEVTCWRHRLRKNRPARSLLM